MPRVTVILTEEEYREIKRRADGMPLTRWFKKLAFAGRIKSKELAFTEEQLAIPEPRIMIGDTELQTAKKEVHQGPRAFRPMKPDKAIDTSLCQHNMMKAACPRCK